MVEIEINVDEIVEALNLPDDLADKLIESTIRGITSRFYYLWQSQAQNNLGKTREEYVKSITMGERGPHIGYVALEGTLPTMIEKGAAPFDMKPGFSRSSKVRTSKGGGWYLTIPFRQATPEASAFSSGFSNIMPQQVYDVAKNLIPRRTGSSFQSGQSLSDSNIPSPHNIPRSRKTIVTKSKVFEEYVHKSSIYSGMKRQAKQYNKRETGTYITFRRVGSKSDPNAFIHKGIEARNFLEKAFAQLDIPHEAEIARNTFLNELF